MWEFYTQKLNISPPTVSILWYIMVSKNWTLCRTCGWFAGPVLMKLYIMIIHLVYVASIQNDFGIYLLCIPTSTVFLYFVSNDFRPNIQKYSLMVSCKHCREKSCYHTKSLSSSSPDENQAAAMSSVKSVFSRKAVVRMQLLKEVVGSDSYRVNNKYDHNHTPLPISEIIQRAQVLIGQEVSYDLLGSNCEHFVTLLRYGEGVSEQVSHCLFCFCLMCHQGKILTFHSTYHSEWWHVTTTIIVLVKYIF